jgi:hypothetical protein
LVKASYINLTVSTFASALIGCSSGRGRELDEPIRGAAL